MNRNEVLEILKENRITTGESLLNLYRNRETDSSKVSKIDSTGGDEGGGEYMMIVLQITNKENNNEVFVKLEGTYSSWDSNYYNDISDFTFVEPTKKIITVYESTPNQDK